jgi:ethanolamine utilization protein EutP
MNRWRFMLWGGVGVGKTTLIQALQGGVAVRKTQMIEFHGDAIDSPGEYAEMGNLTRHLHTTSAGVDLFLVVHDATRESTNFSPNYFRMFNQLAWGVVTKIDAPGANVERASALLRDMGVTDRIFCVSAITGSGIPELRQALSDRREKWRTTTAAAAKLSA